MSFWAVAHLQPQRERIALHCLSLGGFETYCPRLRERRALRGRKIETLVPLFLGYAFLRIELQWHAARRSVGVLDLVMDGSRPAKVPDGVVDELKGREVRGAIELTARPRFKPGTPVRVLRGPLEGKLGLIAGMRPRERVLVLLTLLGASRAVEVPKNYIEAM